MVHAPISLPMIGRPADLFHIRLIRFAFAAILVSLLAGCAPFEVRVVDGPAPAAETEATAEHDPSEAEEPSGVDPLTESILVTAISYLAVFTEVCAALVIGVAVLQALAEYLRFLFGRHHPEATKEHLRLRLARSLAVGLEFTLAADILKTAVAPTWNAIAQLAAIVVLRTVINYFLERELRHAESRNPQAPIEEASRSSVATRGR